MTVIRSHATTEILTRMMSVWTLLATMRPWWVTIYAHVLPKRSMQSWQAPQSHRATARVLVQVGADASAPLDKRKLVPVPAAGNVLARIVPCTHLALHGRVVPATV